MSPQHQPSEKDYGGAQHAILFGSEFWHIRVFSPHIFTWTWVILTLNHKFSTANGALLYWKSERAQMELPEPATAQPDFWLLVTAWSFLHWGVEGCSCWHRHWRTSHTWSSFTNQNPLSNTRRLHSSWYQSYGCHEPCPDPHGQDSFIHRLPQSIFSHTGLLHGLRYL